MTISTEIRKAGPFIGNDSASAFPFAFKVFKASDLIVVRRQDNIGTETTLVLDSDYHVILNGNQDTTPGGVVTLVEGALASGFTLVVSSELPYLQPTDLTNQGGFYPKVITNSLDRQTIFCQQLAEITGRTLKLPITAPTNISTEIPLPNPDELIAWDETGTKLTTVSPQSLVTSIAYGSATADLFAGDGVTTTFPLSTNPASVNNLDVSVGGFSQRPVQDGIGDYSWNGGATITFVEPPPAPAVTGDKNVLVRYMQAIPVSDSEALHAQTREALRRSYAEAGFNLVDGSFETGGALTAATDVMLQESTGSVYAWTGVLPKVVAPGFDPIGVVGFELRTDAMLREEFNERMVYTPKRFATVASMIANASVLQLNDIIQCDSFHAGVLLPSPNQYKITTDTPDGMFVIDIGGGLSATLQNYPKQLFIERIGAKPDLYTTPSGGVVNPDKTDNWPVFNAVKTLRTEILAFGAYYLSQKLDLGNGDVEKYGAITGLMNRNFDGLQSVLAFDGTDGIEVFAGCRLKHFSLINISETKSGIGLKADNVHGGVIDDVCAINFAQGADMFLWASRVSNVITYQCTSGIKITNESTSTTYSSCYPRECGTGFDLGGSFTYSTLQNCAVDNCDIPYLFRGGSNIDLSNCGAEISHANIEGFFRFATNESTATVSISGGRFVTLGGKTCNYIAYAPAGAPNDFGRIQFNRINTNSFSAPLLGFVGGTVRAVIADGCTFADVFPLKVAAGSTGSVIHNFQSGSGSNHCVKTPDVVGVNTTDADTRQKVVIERMIDFAAATAASQSVALKLYAAAADSRMQVTVESWPAATAVSSAVYQRWNAWAIGSNGGNGANDVGTQFNFTTTATSDGFRAHIFNRDAIPGRAFVRVTVEGKADAGYRDVMCSLIVGAL